ncbi:hypothetical protein R2F61_03660 [Mollicutes bacterium LVI A0078]|nr:hypothetical protein RZE84_03690 [Mollicutes bacterium LVI A0075]WOO91659.1 hypothetical protein R2F61_03660 [Mollicutes bacterium LVI A0078]
MHNLVQLGLITGVLLFIAMELIIYTIKPEFFKCGHAFLKRKLLVVILGNILSMMLLFAIVFEATDNPGHEVISFLIILVILFGESWLFSLWNKFDDKRYAQENELNRNQKMYITQPYGSWNLNNPEQLSYAQVMTSYKLKIRCCYIGVIGLFILAITLSSLDLNPVSDFDLKVWAVALIIISVLLVVIIVLELMKLGENRCYGLNRNLKSVLLLSVGIIVLGFIIMLTSLSAFAIILGLTGMVQ